MFELSPAPMWVADAVTLRFLAVNQAAARLYGCSPEELSGKELAEVVLQLGRRKPVGWCWSPEALSAALVGPGWHRRADGAVIEVEVAVRSLGFQGRAACLIVVHDITGRRRTEAELRRLTAELEQRAAERTAELRLANEILRRDARERRRLESQILATLESEQRRIGQDLHDDLGSHLSGIECLCQTLASDLESESPARAAQASEVGRMVRQAMEIARRLSHGLSPLCVEAHGLMTGLRELATHTTTVYHRQCSFQCGGPVRLTNPATALQLYRIAQEAVANAVKHSRAERIEITLAAQGDLVTLKVSDNGCGLPRDRHRCHGQGLRIMKRRATILGGSLVVRRKPRGGSEVVCSLGRACPLSGNGSLK